MMKKLADNLPYIFLFCVTLGLAPFVPEPHIWGKIRWVMGGATGMTGMDWFDLFWHGWPWVLLLVALFAKGKTLIKG
jgi:hypothetical protein